MEGELFLTRTPTGKLSNQANNNRVVVSKHPLTLEELEEDPSLLLDLEEGVGERGRLQETPVLYYMM